MPAYTKAFLEQVFRPGFAGEESTAGKPWKKLLTGKTARIVITMGMPAFIYRWYFLAHSLKSLERNILGFCGIGPINLEKSVGSRFLAQVINSTALQKNARLTEWVRLRFFQSTVKPITCTINPRPTDLSRIKDTLIGMVDAIDDKKGKKWLDKMYQLGADCN